MDASSYLLKQGWRGEGHSLDHTNRGIKKPLLVSKKVDVLGVGLNKHASVSDQWWLRAFDQGLKSLGTGQESALAQVQKHGVHRGGLYAGFVRGERLEGSIGNTPTSTQGTSTPVEAEERTSGNTGIDVPPAHKLKRTVGKHEDQNSHDAMMHLLQNPEDAPASMPKVLDRKRKRAERPLEKRTRRKMQRDEKAKANALMSKRATKEDGTWDQAAEDERRRERLINKRASEAVLAAQKFGYIEAGPNEIRKGQVAVDTEGNTVPQGEPSAELKQIFASVDFTTLFKKSTGASSAKGDKLAREKMKRQLKAAAKAYYMGVEPPNEQSEQEANAEREEKRAQKAKSREEAARKEAHRMARREMRQEQKKEKRKQKKAEKEAIDRILAVRLGSPAKSAETGQQNGTSTAGFENGVDEIKFGMNSKGGLRKVPGVGVIERYLTKAEKKAKMIAATAIREGCTEEEVQRKVAVKIAEKEDAEKEKVDKYRAMKHGMSLEEYRGALARGEVNIPKIERGNISPDKLADYRKRADEKGVSLEQYIKRREEKKAEKAAENLGNPYQQDLYDQENLLVTAGSGSEHSTHAPDGMNDIAMPNADQSLGFVIDTVGDDGDAGLPVTSSSQQQPARPLAIIDTAGNDEYEGQHNLLVPLDPRIWEGKKVSELPRHVRKARKEWMAMRRTERKKAKLEAKAALSKTPA